MAPILNIVKNTSRAAVVALALGASALTALPAQAAGHGPGGGNGPAMTFQLDLGSDGGRNGNQTFAPQGQGQGRVIVPDHRPGRFCLNDRQIRRGIASYGFDNVRIRRDVGRDRVEVNGVYGRWLYSMRVNRCTGYVDRVQPIRPAFGGGGFGFQFDFGN